MSEKVYKLFVIFSWLMILTALAGAFLYAPEERIMGPVQRIFYFHVGSAWNAFFAFFMTFVFSILHLWSGNYKFDRIATSFVKVGVTFTTIVLVTGPLWAKSAWGAFWVWDTRLTLTLVLFFIYIGYLVLRSSVADRSAKARLCAVIGIVGFIDVPLDFFAIRWWNSMHPNVLMNNSGSGGLAPEMLQVLIFSVISFSFLLVTLIIFVYKLETFEEKVNYIESNLS